MTACKGVYLSSSGSQRFPFLTSRCNKNRSCGDSTKMCDPLGDVVIDPPTAARPTGFAYITAPTMVRLRRCRAALSTCSPPAADRRAPLNLCLPPPDVPGGPRRVELRPAAEPEHACGDEDVRAHARGLRHARPSGASWSRPSWRADPAR